MIFFARHFFRFSHVSYLPKNYVQERNPYTIDTWYLFSYSFCMQESLTTSRAEMVSVGTWDKMLNFCFRKSSSLCNISMILTIFSFHAILSKSGKSSGNLPINNEFYTTCTTYHFRNSTWYEWKYNIIFLIFADQFCFVLR